MRTKSGEKRVLRGSINWHQGNISRHLSELCFTLAHFLNSGDFGTVCEKSDFCERMWLHSLNERTNCEAKIKRE